MLTLKFFKKERVIKLQIKKLTRAQRTFVENNNLSTYDWNFIKDINQNEMQKKKKKTKEIRTIQKLNKKIKAS